MRTLLFAAFSVLAIGTIAQTPGPKLLKTVTTRGEVVSLGEDRMRMFFKGSDGMTQAIAFSDSEMFCYLINHPKQEFEVTFRLLEVPKPDGETERRREATEIISLKNGDEFKNWRAKETEKPERAEANHAAVRKYLREHGVEE